jgi:sulfite reductase (NADPH) flavoprotein alpha-component
MDGHETVNVAKDNLPLRDALIQKLDITALSRVNIEKYANLIASEDLKSLLNKENNENFKEYTWGRQILDLVEDYPGDNISAQDFVNILRRIPGRLYSIASSLNAHHGEVHLLVGAVRYHSFDRDREGVCSTFLCGRMQADEKLAIYVQPNKHFHLPSDPEIPIIMVGPGTGLAPFRSFLEERQTSGAKGKNWLFFGDQHQATDFLYADELNKMHQDGFLTNLSLAFSRDQDQKIYVQNRIQESSAEIWAWLEQGAYFYICGDAERMANDVHNALLETVAKEGGLSPELAEKYVNGLMDSRRYQRDVY